MGTRPEVVKLAPVIRALRRRRFSVKTVATAQHRRLADQMLADFRIKPDHDLDLMRPGQNPDELARRVLGALPPVFDLERPNLVLVQGDTTTALAAALSAFHHRIPIGHVEAGLRSFDPANPFPEEKNRVLIDHLSDLLFPPTALAMSNLEREGLSGERVYVTGNTVVDALRWTLKDLGLPMKPAAGKASPRRLLLVTLHRRESFGAALREICEALQALARRHPDLEIVFPVHPNPAVRETACRFLTHPRIRLTAPMSYRDFLKLMRSAHLILTDSGGIQEEAACLRKPVLVARKVTERPEVIRAGGGLLAGTARRGILRDAERLLSDGTLYRRMSRCPNPFGDGRAAERIAKAVSHWLGLGPRPADWSFSFKKTKIRNSTAAQEASRPA